MNTIVFRNNPIEIDKLYLPLTLVKSHSKQNRERFLIDNFPHQLLNKFSKIVITDSAGMGKSTLLKWIFINCILTKHGIPVFIELRKLNNNNDIFEELFKSIRTIDNQIDKELIFSLIKHGNFIFFLDGYDEIPLLHKSEVTNSMQEFMDKAYKNKFILTSRPQSAVASFIDFQEFGIEPLEKEESFKLIKKYDEDGENSNQLIKILLELENNKSLNEFLTNPLMVSLLFKGYEFKKKIPYKKNIFYRQVYDALFEDHDLTKGGAFEHDKKSKLDSEKFHEVLRTFAFITFKKGKIEYSKDEIISFINITKKKMGMNFSEKNFLDDLISSVPLFSQEGNLYNWKHKSLQDYFVAQFICIDTKEYQSKILLGMYESNENENYLNIFDLCYDADYRNFKKIIISHLLNKIISFEKEITSILNFEKMTEFEEVYIKSELFGKKMISLIDSQFGDKIGLLTKQSYVNQMFGKVITKNIDTFKIDFIRMISDIENYLINLESKDRKILSLLFQKQEDIFVDVERYKEFFDVISFTDEELESIYELSFFNEPIFLIDENTILKDIDKTEILKMISLFRNVTLYDQKAYVIDFKKVKNYKHQIEIEKSEEMDEHDFYSF